jgi:hypothetical protein
VRPIHARELKEESGECEKHFSRERVEGHELDAEEAYDKSR